MTKEIAFYIQIALSVVLLLTSRYIYRFVAIKALEEVQRDIFTSYFVHQFAFWRWYLPMYFVWLNAFGWYQIVVNQLDITKLLVFPLWAWGAFVMLHLAWRYKAFVYALISLLILIGFAYFFQKGKGTVVFLYPFVVWLFMVQMMNMIQRSNLFGRSLFVYLIGAWSIFVMLCFFLPRSSDYEIFLFLYLFSMWIGFLGYCMIIAIKKPSMLKDFL